MKHINITLIFSVVTLVCSAQNWTLVGDTQATTSEVSEFNMAINANEDICLAFVNEKGNVRAFARAWKDGKWDNFGTTTGMSASTVNQNQVLLAPNGRYFMLYRDIGLRNGAVVRVYNENLNSWDFYGAQSNGVTGGYTDNIKLAMDNNSIPYIGLKVDQFSTTFNVMAYDTVAKNYKVVIDAGPSGNVPGEYDMAFSPSNELYIAYQDTTFSSESNPLARNRLTIKKWTNGAWELVGKPSISEGQPKDINLVFDSKGTPYVAYVNSSSTMPGWASAVRYFDGTDWKPIGPEYFRFSYATYLDLKVSPDDTLVIAYSALELGGAMAAYAFNGSEWQQVGADKISEGKALWNKIEFSPNGVLYAVYKDDANGGKATVQRYSGNLTFPSMTSSVAQKDVANFSLYPNPTQNILQFSSLPLGPKKISITDAYGKLVLQLHTSKTEEQLQLSSLESGIFFATVFAENARLTRRFIKN